MSIAILGNDPPKLVEWFLEKKKKKRLTYKISLSTLHHILIWSLIFQLC